MTTENAPAPIAHPVLLRLPQVSARAGLTCSELYRRITLGTFPTPIRISELASVRCLVQIGCSIVQRLMEKTGGLAHAA